MLPKLSDAVPAVQGGPGGSLSQPPSNCARSMVDEPLKRPPADVDSMTAERRNAWNEDNVKT